MKNEEIFDLLDRYWEGETTLEEERRIKAYFSAGAIDERLRDVAPLFQAVREEQALQLAAKAKPVAMRPQLYQWAVAASVALLLCAGWWMLNRSKPNAPVAQQLPAVKQPSAEELPVLEKQHPELVAESAPKSVNVPPKKKKKAKPAPQVDPETAQAIAEIKAALALVSAKLDKGRNQAVKNASYLEAMDKVPKRKEG